MLQNENKQKVLVTGSSGFLGSHFADALDDYGFETVLFDKTPSKYKKKYQNEIIGDITDIADINRAIKGCSYIFHFAGQADINDSSKNVSNTIESNIIGTQKILEASVENDIERIFFASTIYVYSELGSFYRVSKQACEKLVEEYSKEFGLDFTILRFGSIYGPRANEFNSINNMITQAIIDGKIVRRGDGEEVREYIHVLDAAQLSLQALDQEFINKHLIITGSQQIKIKELLTMIQEILQDDVEIEYGHEEELHHYQITPYAFKPRIAKKIVPKSHYDLGQGLLDLVFVLADKLQKENNPVNISLRKRK